MVLTAPVQIYNVIEWLPNNDQVLVTVDQYSTRETECDQLLRQSVELYNPETGDSKQYAIRHKVNEPPGWQAGLNAVIYSDMNLVGRDTGTSRLQFDRQIWISYGDPKTAQMLAEGLPQLPLAIKPDGSETIYLSDKELSRLDSHLRPLPSVAFDSARWDYATRRRNDWPVSYEMAWQPGTSLIFLYSEDGMQLGGGYTFILNADTGQICELDLGGWAVQTHWSPDGRYLAILRAAISSSPVNSTDMVILDTGTGNQFRAEVLPPELEGKHYVDDFVWAPDNRHLLAIGRVPSENPGLPKFAGLYLVDFASGDSISVLPNYKFYASMGGDNLAWAPDGSKLLVLCPTLEEARLCYIAVEAKGH